MPDDATKECPFCREEIRADAVLCKHCRSRLTDAAPAHGGTCPFCKESIHEDAIKCKHCGSSVGPSPPGLRDRQGAPDAGPRGGCGGCGPKDQGRIADPSQLGSRKSLYSSSGGGPRELGGARPGYVAPEYGVAYGCLWRCDCIRESELFPGICNEWRCYPIYC